MSNDYAIAYKISGYDTTHTRYLSGDSADDVQQKFTENIINNIHEIEVVNVTKVKESDDKIITCK